MKKKELEKIYLYNRKETSFDLEIQLENYHDAYSDWDFSPFTNRDLDKELAEYLLDCSFEIPRKYKLRIKFYILNQNENELRESRSIIGIQNYFKYQLRKLQNHRMTIMKNIFTFAVVGVILLVSSMYFKKYLPASLAASVFSEGLFIGGWVMFWEMFSAFFFDMKDNMYKKKHFDRLLNSELQYLYGRKGEV